MGEGWSWGPVNPAIKKRMKAEQFDIKYDIEWTTLSDYLYFLQRKGISQNVASFLGADDRARVRDRPGEQEADAGRNGTDAPARRPRDARRRAGHRLGPRVCPRLLRRHRGTDRPVQGGGPAQGEVHHAHAQRRRAASGRDRRGDPHQPRGENPRRNLPLQGGRQGQLEEDGRGHRPGRGGAARAACRSRPTCTATRPAPRP